MELTAEGAEGAERRGKMRDAGINRRGRGEHGEERMTVEFVRLTRRLVHRQRPLLIYKESRNFDCSVDRGGSRSR